ncbi:MAG: organomercurial lyase [Acidimicrobiia bacterium]
MPATTNPPTVAELADALAAATPDLGDQDRHVVLATYRLLAGGTPVTDEQVATAAGAPLVEVARRLREWPGVFRDADEAIIGFWGLARDPLDPEYRLQTAGSSAAVYAWCAWDTLFLPTVLGQTLDVTATDFRAGEPIRLTVAPEGVSRVKPSDAVVTFLVPDGPFDADVVASFCHKVLFFANENNAAEWIAAHPDELFTLSVDEAFEVGRLVTRANYGDALAN